MNLLPQERAAQEAYVRQNQRVCRGLPALTSEQRKPLHDKWNSAFAAGDWALASAVVIETETAAKIKGGPVNIIQSDVNAWDELFRRMANALFAHGDTVGKPCGADFNDIICSQPFDGELHHYTCPKCGQVGVYRAPVFPSDSQDEIAAA